MLKPDWKDAPEWANWLAMDKDGEWWWYAEKPTFYECDPEYFESGYWSSVGKNEMAKCLDSEYWKTTLEERPNGEFRSL